MWVMKDIICRRKSHRFDFVTRPARRRVRQIVAVKVLDKIQRQLY
jgi:hypothetical protein